MKKKSTTVALVLLLLAGLSLLLYPTLADYWNKFRSSRAVSNYVENVQNMDEKEYEKVLDGAKEYNQKLTSQYNGYYLNEAMQAEYQKTLNISGTGIMGYIEIPSINCSLPIQHGTNDDVLQTSIGHLEWSSLPVGGESTHCVLSGHRGLPSARLFTDLDRLREGDTFVLRVLNETLTYEIDKILIVEPNDMKNLTVEKGKDLCTLVTCTPYGVNTHRLLVRGHRTENAEDASSVHVTSDAVRIEPLVVAPIAAIPLLVLMLAVLFIFDKRKNKNKRTEVKRSENEE